MTPRPFADRLDPATRERLAALGATHHLAAGVPLILEGDLGNRAWIVRSGLVKISAVHRDGVAIVVALRGPGELIGELAILDDEPRSASAVALVPTTVQVMAADHFLGFLKDHPAAGIELTRDLAARLRASDGLRLGQAAEDVNHRLARCLTDLGRQYGRTEGSTVIIDLPLTQVDLAGIVGASRDSVAKILRAWRDEDLVRTSRRRIELVDATTLTQRYHL